MSLKLDTDTLRSLHRQTLNVNDVQKSGILKV